MAKITKIIAIDEASDQIEISNVLAQYLELFSFDCNQFKYYMAPNSIIDWFGRTIRGPVRIHQYLRYEISTQYEHINFKNAKPCAPIECTQQHMKTKVISRRDVDYIHPTNRIVGVSSLKLFAESDVEDEDIFMESYKFTIKTEERSATTTAEELAPPSSSIKEPEHTETQNTDNEDEPSESKCKRFKQSPASPTPYSWRSSRSAIETTLNSRIYHVGRAACKDSSSEDELPRDRDPKMKVNAYTPLRYLEAVGILHVKPEQTKDGDDSDSHYSFTDAAGWDREIRIRISYRKRIADQHLQFALVIYDHVDRPEKNPYRRNLMLEFSQTVQDLDDDADSDDATASNEALGLTSTEETVATVERPTTAEIAAALETAAFTIAPMRTPTKKSRTPPPTPRRRPRALQSSGARRANPPPSPTTSAPRRSAARSLRL